LRPVGTRCRCQCAARSEFAFGEGYAPPLALWRYKHPPYEAADAGSRAAAAEQFGIDEDTCANYSAYGVLFDAASQELDAQLTSADALDQKAATVFSVASRVAVVVPALLPLGKSGLEFKSWAFGFLYAGGAGYAATLVLFFLAYRPGRWASGPDLERLREVIGHGEDYAHRWAADAYVLSIEVTRVAVRSKRRFLNGAMAAFVFEIVMLVVAAVSTFSR
jgi:hypothetical protein